MTLELSFAALAFGGTRNANEYVHTEFKIVIAKIRSVDCGLILNVWTDEVISRNFLSAGYLKRNKIDLCIRGLGKVMEFSNYPE